MRVGSNKRNTLCVAIAAAMLHAAMPLAAFAAGQAGDAQEGEADAAVTQLDAVKVSATGTRLARAGYDAPTPVTVASADELLLTTPSGIPDGLNKLPQFMNSNSPARSTHNFANTSANGNILNLRGVGGNRALILFDGVRVAPTAFNGAVDVDVLPTALVSQVDVVTAGASAAYGSDAVAGVVNFVLDRGFVGHKGSAQYGISEQGDNAYHKLSYAGGWTLADGRGHLLLGIERHDSDGMAREDRDISLRGYNFVGANPGAGPAGSAANPYVLGEDVRINASSPGGLVLGGPLAGNRFLPDGSLVPFNPGQPTGTPGYGYGGDGYAILPRTTAVTPQEMNKLFARASYDFEEGVTAYASVIASRGELSYTSLGNSFNAPNSAYIALDNPYLNLTQAQRDALAAAGADHLRVGVAADASNSSPLVEEVTDYRSLVTGLEGTAGETWSWDLSFTLGRSDHQVTQNGVFDRRNAFAASDVVLDAAGRPACYASLSSDPAIAARYADCRPLNVLGVGSMQTTPDGFDYILGTSWYRTVFDTRSAAFTTSGELFQLPAGAVDVAVGVEWRRQTISMTSNANPALLDTPEERSAYFAGLRGVPAATLFYDLTNVGEAHGSVEVREVFSEVNVPLLRDAVAAHALDLNAAVRLTDYSTSGLVRTWKLGAVWSPLENWMLRGTVSRDIRAPTLFDLYSSEQSSIGQLQDPVTGTTGNLITMSGGNTGLKPEEADTLSIGTVFSPNAIPGLSLSLDYYRLEINGAIGTLSAPQIVQNCHASGGTTPECALISRPTPGAFPSLVRTAPANIAVLETSGFDFDATWRGQVGPGNLVARLFVNYLDTFRTQQSHTAPVYEYAGTGQPGSQPIARPNLRGSLSLRYILGDVELAASGQYIGGFRIGSDEPNQFFDHPDAGSMFYTDISASTRLGDAGNWQVFAAVNNVFDRSPPIIPGVTPGVNLPTIISMYDYIGRSYSVGVRFSF